MQAYLYIQTNFPFSRPIILMCQARIFLECSLLSWNVRWPLGLWKRENLWGQNTSLDTLMGTDEAQSERGRSNQGEPYGSYHLSYCSMALSSSHC